MKTIKLTKAWTYRTPLKTIDYPAGPHEVTEEVYSAAVADGAITEETANGDGAAKTGAKGAADAPKG